MDINILSTYIHVFIIYSIILKQIVTDSIKEDRNKTEFSEQTALQEALILVEILKSKYAEAVNNRAYFRRSGSEDNRTIDNSHNLTSLTTENYTKQSPFITTSPTQQSTILLLTPIPRKSEQSSITPPPTSNEGWKFSQPQPVTYFLPDYVWQQSYYQHFQTEHSVAKNITKQNLMSWQKPTPVPTPLDGDYKFSRQPGSYFSPEQSGYWNYKRRFPPGRRRFNSLAYFYDEAPMWRRYNEYLDENHRRGWRREMDYHDPFFKTEHTSPSTTARSHKSSASLKTEKLTRATKKRKLTKAKTTKTQQTTSLRSKTTRRKITTHQTTTRRVNRQFIKKHTSDKATTTSRDNLMSQIASEVYVELKDLRVRGPSSIANFFKRSENRTRKPKAHTASLRIYLERSKRYPIPLPDNNLFCYTNPKNALCRTFI